MTERVIETPIKLSPAEAARHLATSIELHQFAFGVDPTPQEALYRYGEILVNGVSQDLSNREVPDVSELPEEISKSFLG